MNDENTKKALEDFYHRVENTNLSYHIFESERETLKDALDLINRYQAEIKRLQNTIDDVLDREPLLVERAEKYAIEEFAERLIELQCLAYDTYEGGKTSFEHTADVLLANGVVVPPVKVGQTVYFLHNGIELCEARIICTEYNYYTNPQMWITVEFFSKVIGINTYKSRIDLMLNKIMFLTREEAERALKGSKK